MSVCAGRVELIPWLFACSQTDKSLTHVFYEHILRFQDLGKDVEADDNIFFKYRTYLDSIRAKYWCFLIKFNKTIS